MIAFCSHVSPEGMLDGPVRLMTYGVFSIWLAAFLATYVLPMLAALITGPKKRVIAPVRLLSVNEAHSLLCHPSEQARWGPRPPHEWGTQVLA
jgi:hypothetical protein